MNEKGKVVLLMFFLVLFTIPLASAVENEVSYLIKQLETFDLKNECFNNNTFCSSAAVCNITIFDPKGGLTVDNKVMTNQNNFHNYTISATDLNLTGDYSARQICFDGVRKGEEPFLIRVTPTGEEGLLGFYFLIIILSYGVMLFGVFKQDITVTLLGTFSLYFVGIFMLFFGLDVFKNYLTNAFALITLGVAAYMSVIMANEYISTA